MKKSLKVGAIGGGVLATSAIASTTGKVALQADSNGVVLGKSNKKEVLYKKAKSGNTTTKSLTRGRI